MLWKIESEEDFFKIYDSKKMLAGYFDPDYGDVFPKDQHEQIVSSMLKNHDAIPGGAMVVPLVKFCLFDTDLNASIFTVEEHVIRVQSHLEKWKGFLAEARVQNHSISISHTDQDMLTMAFPMRFSKLVPLREKDLVLELSPTLDLLQRSDLL